MSLTHPNVHLIREGRAEKRRMRRPQHTFYVEWRPYQLQPFFIAPVLPGETLKNLLLQARCVSMPIQNPLIGWWLEYYFFYVRHRDIDAKQGGTALQTLMLDASATLNAYGATGDKAAHYYENHTANEIDFVDLCMDCIVPEYFRSETDGTVTQINGLEACRINQETYLDSMILTSNLETPDDITLTAVGSEYGAEVRASEIERAMRQYELLKTQNLVDMSYEDFLRMYGVRLPNQEILGKPELVRYIREWSYPTNTIDPTSGTPRSAVSWSVAERADKDRYFKEPGFLVGVTVCRPKVYLTNLRQPGVSMMTDAYSWLPAIMADDPHTSLKKFASGQGPVNGSLGEYWVDLRDLFLYGDQFYNIGAAAMTGAKNGVAMPAAITEAGKKYPTTAMVDALFIDTTTGVGKFRQDGVVSLTVATHAWLKDTSPQFEGKR